MAIGRKEQRLMDLYAHIDCVLEEEIQRLDELRVSILKVIDNVITNLDKMED